METLNAQEGQLMVRSLFFDGNDFVYCKNRMYYFCKSEGVDLWDVVENGPFTPTKVVKGVHVAKPNGEWSEQEKKKVALNDKAIHVLFCTLSRSECNKLDETISQMYDRFVEIIGRIKSLGKTFTNKELIKKILRSLPKEWLPKVTSHKDSKDLSKVQLDELLENFIDYEMTLKKEQFEEPSKAKKNIVFNVFSKNSSDKNEEFDEEELALVTRRIRRMLCKNKKFILKRNFKKDKGESSKKDLIICYEFNKLSHIETKCLKLKKPSKKFKKKALKATWNESSDSKDKEIGNKVANICFMVMEESSNEVTLSDNDVEFSCDELVNVFKVMNDELEWSHKKKKLLKSELVSLRKESETSSKLSRPLDNDTQKNLK
ncbi:uncharacterized protein LOC131178357 [Hevea brasiliensis]|uniref:uncharacterized protein LOC131178357 n=1 Tax=Hevea brasiliensis TaxID=3981 RepID=UPI0025D18348|nr:uncharacterized protein LOC131178357 [Hevea brasiliensis]